MMNSTYKSFPNSKSKYINKYFKNKINGNLIKITGYRYSKYSGMLTNCYIFKPISIKKYDGYIDDLTLKQNIGLIDLAEIKNCYKEMIDKNKLMVELL